MSIRLQLKDTGDRLELSKNIGNSGYINTTGSKLKRPEQDSNVICILCESHKLIRGDQLLKQLGNKVFVNMNLSCYPCEHRGIANEYARGVNLGNITYPYEAYRDASLEAAMDEVIFNSDLSNKEQIEKLQKLQNDLRAYNKEKTYDVDPKTEEEKIELLRKQNYYIEVFTTNKYLRDKYIIHLPTDRLDTLPFEQKILNSIVDVTNLFKKYFVVFKEEYKNAYHF